MTDNNSPVSTSTSPRASGTADKWMDALSRLLLPLRAQDAPSGKLTHKQTAPVGNLTCEDFDEFVALANSNHVLVRALEVFLDLMREAGDATRADWAETALAAERWRIRYALTYLHDVCDVFEQAGRDITVMKSLDHWPDLGSDLDLYTSAPPQVVVGLMRRHFGAALAERSWGDRLARKYNFDIPDLPEPAEFHVGRLGQTGEQILLAARLPRRARRVAIDNLTFPVPSASDRIMISTLQRMYRHFYFRLCDIIDSAALAKSGALDYDDLRRSAQAAGIWEGVATYLVIVSDYLKRYDDPGLDLPREVRAAARFGGSRVYFRKSFLRVPILPHSVNLYRSQLGGLVRRGEVESTARLSLLPWLATAAFVEQKRTGSDKGIW